MPQNAKQLRRGNEFEGVKLARGEGAEDTKKRDDDDSDFAYSNLGTYKYDADE